MAVSTSCRGCLRDRIGQARSFFSDANTSTAFHQGSCDAAAYSDDASHSSHQRVSTVRAAQAVDLDGIPAARRRCPRSRPPLGLIPMRVGDRSPASRWGGFATGSGGGGSPRGCSRPDWQVWRCRGRASGDIARERPELPRRRPSNDQSTDPRSAPARSGLSIHSALSSPLPPSLHRLRLRRRGTSQGGRPPGNWPTCYSAE